jgi:hypothetical protein
MESTETGKATQRFSLGPSQRRVGPLAGASPVGHVAVGPDRAAVDHSSGVRIAGGTAHGSSLIDQGTTRVDVALSDQHMPLVVQTEGF